MKTLLIVRSRDLYNTNIRSEALRLTLLKIEHRQTSQLVKYIGEWPAVEIRLFLWAIMLRMPAWWAL
jgi:hypothetical protein